MQAKFKSTYISKTSAQNLGANVKNDKYLKVNVDENFSLNESGDNLEGKKPMGITSGFDNCLLGQLYLKVPLYYKSTPLVVRGGSAPPCTHLPLRGAFTAVLGLEY